MDMKYIEYAFADKRFYVQLRGDQSQQSARGQIGYKLSQGESDTEWISVEANGWRHHQPKSIQLPDQGWKIHWTSVCLNFGHPLLLTGRPRWSFEDGS